MQTETANSKEVIRLCLIPNFKIYRTMLKMITYFIVMLYRIQQFTAKFCC